MSTSIKVAVRVRPFNEREKRENCSCIVQMQDNKTILSNKASSKANSGNIELKEFSYDYSYWSHDANSSHYISQERVFDDLGSCVVTNSLEGYNACVFAYGQTGSGKTFTMMGSKNNPGLIPRICQHLYSCMEKGKEAGTTYKVEVSYLEIYNEKIRDLLHMEKGSCADAVSLNIREGKHGTYVENLSHHSVAQYSEVEDLMQKGNEFRTTASTKMNDTSSRSHAVFTLTFIQAKLQADVPVETRSKINLVDLAGSERADASGATGKRLKEGGHINKSLSTLGQVINALAERVKSKKETFIPYRNSKLTQLLRDSLGGNSKTIMIATISPAEINYGETLSTLRYANQAKSIINKPTINEDDNVKLIRELRAEIAKLKNRIDVPSVEEGSIRAKLSKKEAQEKVLTDEWTEKWKQTQSILQEQPLELRKAGEGRGVVLDSELPHLVLYDDNLGSTGVTMYYLNEEITTIGASQEQDIQLEGQGMCDEHCIIKLQGQNATLERKVDAEVIVDDKLVERSTSLIHGALIMLGGSHVFRYNDPEAAARIRKQGNRSSLNLSRLSFLSRSTTDLPRGYDSLIGTPNDLTDTCDASKVADRFEVFKMNETGFCEISTQTSAGTHNSSKTPIASEVHALSFKEKTNLTLPLDAYMEQLNDSPSFNSTPASDTFYTATSILTPDVSDLLSPLSPITNTEAQNSELNDHMFYQREPMSLFNDIACASINNSPIKPTARLLNSPGALIGATTSTPKRDINSQLVLIKHESDLNVGENSTCEELDDKLAELNNDLACSLPKEKTSNSSELMYAHDDNKKIDVVIEKIFANEQNGRSILEQKEELKGLQNHYTELENEIIEELKITKGTENGEKKKIEKSRHLTLDSLLKEERVVLIIEKEVRRRLLEEMCNLEKKGCLHKPEECECTCDSRMVRSASPNSMISVPRTLSPSELRPYSSLSADAYEYGAVRNVMYESRTSSDDLLVPVPLYSPSDGDYDMSCGICVSLPSYELRGSGSTAYWEYQIRLSLGRDCWQLFRRYRRFRELHLFMSQKYGSVIEDVYFPPRRIFGNHSLSVVEKRRKELETYLQQLITLCSDMEGSPLCDVTPTKNLLEKFSPFFREGASDVNRRFKTS